MGGTCCRRRHQALVGRDNGGSAKSPSPSVGLSVKTVTIVENRSCSLIFKEVMLERQPQDWGSVNTVSSS